MSKRIPNVNELSRLSPIDQYQLVNVQERDLIQERQLMLDGSVTYYSGSQSTHLRNNKRRLSRLYRIAADLGIGMQDPFGFAYPSGKQVV